MYSHNMVGTNDVAKAKAFYDATFQAIGGKPGIEDDKGRLIYMHNGGLFLVTPPINGEPATAGNGCTIGFAMEDEAQAKAWHDAGVAAGGTSILLIEQNFSLVHVVAERYYVLSKGAVVEQGQLAGLSKESLKKHVAV